MPRRLLLCCTFALFACAPAGEQAGSDSSASGASLVAAPIALADLAGTWDMKTMPMEGDSVLLTSEMVATADTSGWMQHFEGRDPLPIKVMVSGDSVVTDMGPYESLFRPGVMVTVHSVSRLEDGKMVGMATGHYMSGGADSVAMFRVEGTRRAVD